MEHVVGPGGRLSRRQTLTLAGAAAVGAWAAPLVVSGTAEARSPASRCTRLAAQRAARGRDDTACAVCFSQPECGFGCTCIPTKGGCCFCHEPSFCADLERCSAQSDCPPGYKCAYSCCGGLLCIPPCRGLAEQAAVRAGGRRHGMTTVGMR